jgi:hypothetical protein
MLSITAFAGTQRVSGLRLIRDLETMGAQIASSADREKVSTFFLSTQTDQYSSFYINLVPDKKSILLSVQSTVWLIKLFVEVNDCVVS